MVRRGILHPFPAARELALITVAGAMLLAVGVPFRPSRNETDRVSAGGATLEHRAPSREAGEAARTFTVRLTGADSATTVTMFVRQNERPYRTLPLHPEADGSTWSAALPGIHHGTLIRYRIEARLADGTKLALPLGSAESANYRYLVVEAVPARVTWLRGTALWISLVLSLAAAFLGARANRLGTRAADLVGWSLLSMATAAVLYLIGAVCLSWVHSYYATGSPWSSWGQGPGHPSVAALVVAGYWLALLFIFGGRLFRPVEPAPRAVTLGLALASGAGAAAIFAVLSLGLVSP